MKLPLSSGFQYLIDFISDLPIINKVLIKKSNRKLTPRKRRLRRLYSLTCFTLRLPNPQSYE